MIPTTRPVKGAFGMKKQLEKFGWGFGLYADRDGNLHDTFPRVMSEEKEKKPHGKWRVKTAKKRAVLVP